MWIETITKSLVWELSIYLIKNGCPRGITNSTLFIKSDNENIVITKIYVDDIVFGSTFEEIKDEFINVMKVYFDMSMVGELINFLGLQINQ